MPAFTGMTVRLVGLPRLNQQNGWIVPCLSGRQARNDVESENNAYLLRLVLCANKAMAASGPELRPVCSILATLIVLSP